MQQDAEIQYYEEVIYRMLPDCMYLCLYVHMYILLA
jgi:hypothetical protein